MQLETSKDCAEPAFKVSDRVKIIVSDSEDAPKGSFATVISVYESGNVSASMEAAHNGWRAGEPWYFYASEIRHTPYTDCAEVVQRIDLSIEFFDDLAEYRLRTGNMSGADWAWQNVARARRARMHVEGGAR